jgi:F-type H+-transporting ATPase subunit delta
MKAASRDSRAAVKDRFDELAAGSDPRTLDTLGAELSAVTSLLRKELVLRKHLSESSSPVESKQRLLAGVLGGKIADTTMQVLRSAVEQRWSNIRDFVDTVEYFGRQAVLTSAERAGVVEDVEDELFRFERVVSSDGRLNTLLADDRTDADGRVRLLDELVAQKVKPQTKALLEQFVRVPRGRRTDAVVAELAELAAARKEESVAQVTAAAPLSQQQRERLAQVLSNIYRKTISLQVQVDPEVLGGLLIRIGDEVVDGSLASKLAKAGQDLPN